MAEGIERNNVQARVQGPVNMFITAVNDYRDVWQRIYLASLEELHVMDAFLATETRQKDLVADYIQTRANTRALIQTGATMMALWQPTAENPGDRSLVDSFVGVAASARDVLPGVIGDLIRVSIDTTNQALQSNAAYEAWVSLASSGDLTRANAAWQNAVRAARVAVAGTDYGQGFSDAETAFFQATQGLSAASKVARDGYFTQMDILADYETSGAEVIDHLNQLALQQTEGPATAAGNTPDNAPAPDAAPRVADAVLSEDDLDDATKQNLLASLALYQAAVPNTQAALKNYIQKAQEQVDVMLTACDRLSAALLALISPV